jgi:hypothetical protein
LSVEGRRKGTLTIVTTGRGKIGGHFCGGGTEIELLEKEPSLSWHFRRATPFDTLIIVIILVAGLGMIDRSQHTAHA